MNARVLGRMAPVALSALLIACAPSPVSAQDGRAAIVASADAPAPTPLSPEAREHIRLFSAQFPWFDLHGRDPDSQAVLRLDNKVAADGFDPASAAYWDELELRMRRQLPWRFVGRDSRQAEPARANATPPPAVAQPPGDPIGTALAQYKLAWDACDALYSRKKIKTHVAFANCADANLIGSMAAAGWPYMDVLYALVSQHLTVAEKADKRQISGAEFGAENERLWSVANAEVQRRDLANARARANSDAAARAAAAQERTAAAAEAAALAQSDMAAQIQAQAAAQADAERRAALLRFSAGMLRPPGGAGGFGASLQNGLNAAAGIPAPVRTVCERNGNEVSCVSQ